MKALPRGFLAFVSCLLVHASAGAEESVQIKGNGVTLEARAFAPRAIPQGRRPAIVLLHGCEGLTNARGDIGTRHREWAELLAQWGYVVVMVDSFRPRGLSSICALKDRPIQPWQERTEDAYAALDYLAGRADVDPRAVFVMGWSNGGATVLGTVRKNAPGRHPDGPSFKAAIAYYPSCDRATRQKQYRPTMPLLILIGGADDWTPAAPCVELAKRLAQEGLDVRTIVYPGAYHTFDSSDYRIRFKPDVHNPGAPNGRGAHTGGQWAARRKAIEDTKRFLEQRTASAPPAR